METEDVTREPHAGSQGSISATVHNPLTIPLDGGLTLARCSNEWEREFNVRVNVPPRSTDTFRIFLGDRTGHIPPRNSWGKDQSGNVFDTIDTIEKRSARPGRRC